MKKISYNVRRYVRDLEIKKEWLIDRAEYMLAEIDAQIDHLRVQIEKDKNSINKIEKDFKASEEDFVIAATDSELEEKEIEMQLGDLIYAHENDEYLVRLKQHLEYEELQLIALRQDREIYLYYLTNNEN